MDAEKGAQVSMDCTRREFFSRSGRMALNAASSLLSVLGPLKKNSSPKEFLARTDASSWVRPPGALKEKDFLTACTRCGDCVKACPPLVLRSLGPEWGEKIEGTPSLRPSEGPCLMCEGFPCIAACPEGALIAPAPGETLRLGMAVVNEDSCLLKDSQPCRECEKSCPPNTRAIRSDLNVNKVFIDEKTCVGCGLCAQICPTQAIGIRLLNERI